METSESLVYVTPVDSDDDDHIAWISVAAAHVFEIPGIFEHICKSHY